MSKNTKGPWIIDMPTIHNGKKEIAFVLAPSRRESGTNRGSMTKRDEQLSNARLIAAAPELLDAAKAFMRIVYNDVGITREQMKLLREAGLQEAIAKAEGRE